MVEPQKLGAGSGWSWIKEGFYYFKQNPVTWILACIVMLIIFAGLSFIPLLNLAGSLLGPVFTAGFMLGCQKVYQGDDFTLGDLFSGFQTNAGALVLVGLINLLMTIAVIVVAFGILIAAMGMDGMALLGQLRSSPDPAAILVPMLLMVLLAMALLIPVMMAYMFAPALVAIHGVPVMRSFALSFKGCLRNMIPFFTYSILVTLLFIAAVIPIGLGLLILIPVLICSLFAAYRQIYTDSVLAE
ncbi:MAG: hypothetical protein A2V90_09450 [Gammaproteobacteria bacterium RBG_16_57_12]|nr:MAG: hypothetical protein A2V90_09450 [Gammaproteobacteria bacterium RBG_16_57_12]